MRQPQLAQLKQVFLERFGLPLRMLDTRGAPMAESAADRVSLPLCALLEACPGARVCCEMEHRRAIETAFALGEPYSFVCHAGLLATCVPLASGARRRGALFCGQTLPESFNAGLAQETAQRLAAFGLSKAAISAALHDHLFVPGQVLQRAAEFLNRAARRELRLDARILDARREKTRQQAQIAETIQELKRQNAGAPPLYPVERERELLRRVRAGDRVGARAVLNQILGAILFRDPAGSPLFKLRLVELLALVSRAAADAGLDVEKALNRNLAHIGKLLRARGHSACCVLITKALNEFLALACVNREAEAEHPAAAIAAYMETEFERKLTVAELARRAHLSPSRASHVFKEHYGMSMLDMLIRVRIAHARKLLLETNLSCLEIALRAGFQEQAYFTRMFKKIERLTPRAFRVRNRRVEPD